MSGGSKTTPARPKRNGTNGRDGKGRFIKGNAGGPGNPQTGEIYRLKEAFRECVTVEDVKAVYDKLLDMAKAGNILAIKEFLDRAIGKPKQTIEMDTPVPFALYLNIDDSQI